MFSIRIKTTPIFVSDNGNISEAIDCVLIYNRRVFRFIEQNGLYAYADFFEDDEFPEQCYKNGELLERYQDGIFVNMINGGWNQSLSNLLQTIDFLDISIDDEDEENILSFITRLKNGEGIRRNEDEIMLKNYEGDEVEINYLEELQRIYNFDN